MQAESLNLKEPIISIIIPAYNEEKRICSSLQKLLIYLSNNFHDSYEILVVMDGCTNGTSRIVNAFTEHNRRIVQLSYPNRLGKGGAIIEALRYAKGRIIAFIDADFPITLKDFHNIIELTMDYDLVIGSRYCKGATLIVKENFSRTLLSRGFNVLLKIFFWRLRGINDTQCGAKAFRRSVIEKIGKDLFITDFAFDVNLIYSTLRHGLKVKEVGVKWSHESSGSKLSTYILIITIKMFISVIRLRIYYSQFRRILENSLIRTLSSLIYGL
ncbi:MAG: glycosyltransferase family 2 protein [Nitrososphaeria archaeon]